MKKTSIAILIQCFVAALAMLAHPVLNAQDSTGTSNQTTTTTRTETTTTTWYAEPWVWVVGGVLVLLIIIALVRSGRSRDTEVSRTTVIRDNR